MSVDIATYVHDLAVAAKAASASLATASDEQRQEAVRAMAAALRNGVDSIVAANELDMSAARDAGTSAGLLDRLLLTPERVRGHGRRFGEARRAARSRRPRARPPRACERCGPDPRERAVGPGRHGLRGAPQRERPTPQASASVPATPAFYAAARWPITRVP